MLTTRNAMPSTHLSVEDKLDEATRGKFATLLNNCRRASRDIDWAKRYTNERRIARNTPNCTIYVCDILPQATRKADAPRTVILKVKTVDQKTSDKHDMLSWNARELFMMEIVAAHPHIVRLENGFISPQDEVFIEMEYCDCTLTQYVRERQGALPIQIAQLALTHALRGLAHCHSKNVVHGDIKGENLLVRKVQGQDSEIVIKIADFGAATQVGADGYSKRPNFNINSFSYRPIEILGLYPGYSGAVDIWALACTLATLHGPARSPFKGEDIQAVVDSINVVCGPIPEAFRLYGQNKDLPSPHTAPALFAQTFDYIPLVFHDLLQTMLRLDHTARPSAGALLWDPVLNCVLSE